MTNHWPLAGLLHVLIFATTSTGCADMAAGVSKAVLDKAFESTPPEIEASLEASADLNPDASHKPSPLIVRLYELSDITEFNAAEFYTLYEKDKDVLAKDIKGREEFMLLPNEKKTLERELKMETRYLGIVAGYYDMDKAVWRASVETPIDETTEVKILFGANAITIEPVDD